MAFFGGICEIFGGTIGSFFWGFLSVYIYLFIDKKIQHFFKIKKLEKNERKKLPMDQHDFFWGLIFVWGAKLGENLFPV